MTIMDGPFSSCKNKWDIFDQIIETIDRHNAFLVINYHNCNLDSFDFPSYNDDYIKMISFLKDRGALFMTMSQAYYRVLNKE